MGDWGWLGLGLRALGLGFRAFAVGGGGVGIWGFRVCGLRGLGLSCLWLKGLEHRVSELRVWEFWALRGFA